ncbi:MAG: DUF4062 domain-containing protein, partial [Planctomycetaceae bacterium]|nr:DUF4062 domain-containing protein [Planctomycetaceae bacterium]
MVERHFSQQVFISCSTDEFERADASFAGLRTCLAKYLRRAECHVRVQEDFSQTHEDTLEKLNRYIQHCDVVIHIVGSKPGAVASAVAVQSYLKSEPRFLEELPDLRDRLEDFNGITYAQWEAFIALHHARPLLVYCTDDGFATQQ